MFSPEHLHRTISRRKDACDCFESHIKVALPAFINTSMETKDSQIKKKKKKKGTTHFCLLHNQQMAQNTAIVSISRIGKENVPTKFASFLRLIREMKDRKIEPTF